MATVRVTYLNSVGVDVDAADPSALNTLALQAKAQAAVTNNIAALALPAPTYPLSNAAQQALVTQVQALTRQVNALIRLAEGLLDSTDGT
jgi:hypothetical protein